MPIRVKFDQQCKPESYSRHPVGWLKASTSQNQSAKSLRTTRVIVVVVVVVIPLNGDVNRPACPGHQRVSIMLNFIISVRHHHRQRLTVIEFINSSRPESIEFLNGTSWQTDGWGTVAIVVAAPVGEVQLVTRLNGTVTRR